MTILLYILTGLVVWAAGGALVAFLVGRWLGGASRCYPSPGDYAPVVDPVTQYRHEGVL